MRAMAMQPQQYLLQRRLDQFAPVSPAAKTRPAAPSSRDRGASPGPVALEKPEICSGYGKPKGGHAQARKQALQRFNRFLASPKAAHMPTERRLQLQAMFEDLVRCMGR